MSSNTKIIVGLGNPGEEYAATRHNSGFIAVEILAAKLGAAFAFNKKFNADIAQSGDLILVKPQTFMNKSGQAVAAIMNYYKLLPKKTLGLFAKADVDLSDGLIVIHDDKDIELGKFKIGRNQGDAGHRGVQSIIQNLKTKNFTRVRLGVKTEALQKIPTDKFVLGKFNGEEMVEIKTIIEQATTNLV